MKRRLVQICVFLILGAIFNVAVAWAFAFKSCNGSEWTGQDVLASLGQRSEYDSSVDDSGEFTLIVNVRDSRGWPLPCLRSEQTVRRWVSETNGQPSAVNDLSTRFGIDVGFADDLLLPGGGRRLMPLLPMFPDFAINTLFYAGVLWMLFATPFALRRRSRRRRGLCVKCGYDLRGRPEATGCPECGATR